MKPLGPLPENNILISAPNSSSRGFLKQPEANQILVNPNSAGTMGYTNTAPQTRQGLANHDGQLTSFDAEDGGRDSAVADAIKHSLKVLKD